MARKLFTLLIFSVSLTACIQEPQMQADVQQDSQSANPYEVQVEKNLTNPPYPNAIFCNGKIASNVVYSSDSKITSETSGEGVNFMLINLDNKIPSIITDTAGEVELIRLSESFDGNQLTLLEVTGSQNAVIYTVFRDKNIFTISKQYDFFNEPYGLLVMGTCKDLNSDDPKIDEFFLGNFDFSNNPPEGFDINIWKEMFQATNVKYGDFTVKNDTLICFPDYRSSCSLEEKDCRFLNLKEFLIVSSYSPKTGEDLNEEMKYVYRCFEDVCDTPLEYNMNNVGGIDMGLSYVDGSFLNIFEENASIKYFDSIPSAVDKVMTIGSCYSPSQISMPFNPQR